MSVIMLGFAGARLQSAVIMHDEDAGSGATVRLAITGRPHRA
jgi:hypothetical protein